MCSKLAEEENILCSGTIVDGPKRAKCESMGASLIFGLVLVIPLGLVPLRIPDSTKLSNGMSIWGSAARNQEKERVALAKMD